MLELSAPATPATVDLVQDLVARLWAHDGAAVGAADRMRFESALVEIVANVIEHGTPARPGGELTMSVTLRRHAGELVAEVRDDGAAVEVDIDSRVMSGPDHEGGRGLAMARALTDELRYERSIALNRWTIRCRWSR